MQVEPIKPTLKAPVTKRLKLQYETLLSNVAFKFNLRRYSLSASPFSAQPPQRPLGKAQTMDTNRL